MSSLQQDGVVHRIGEISQITDKLTKQYLVIETVEEKYPQIVQFEATNEALKQIEGLKVGDKIKIHFTLRGKEWIRKDQTIAFFNSLSIWKIEKI